MCTTSGAVLLVTVSFRHKVEKGNVAKSSERKKEQNEAEHGGSAIDGVHVPVFPLGSVDSVLYPGFAPDRKQRAAFVALLLRSSYSRHTLHVI